MRRAGLALALVLAAPAWPAGAQGPARPAEQPPRPPRKIVEIYRIAPGEHIAFMKMIAELDAINRKAGVAPRELYVHSEGAAWDFMLIQPLDRTPAEEARIAAAMREMGVKPGPSFFPRIRRFVAWHEDTRVLGPTTAQDWLKAADAP